MKSAGTQTRDDDATLVKRARSGQRVAFDRLTRKYVPKCYRIARRFGLSPEDSADVVQETFLAAFQALDTFNFSFQFSTWITRIHVNKLLNYRRSLNRAKRFFWQRPREEQATETFEGSWQPTPETDAEKAELHEQLIRALDQLPEKQRLIFILFEMEGYKTREIAALFQIPEGTVNSRLRKARLSLRQHLRDYL